MVCRIGRGRQRRRGIVLTIEGTYRNGQVELDETPPGVETARVLVTFVPESASKAEPVKLHGIWKDVFPKDADVDAILREIRSEWCDDLDPTGHGTRSPG